MIAFRVPGAEKYRQKAARSPANKNAYAFVKQSRVADADQMQLANARGFVVAGFCSSDFHLLPLHFKTRLRTRYGRWRSPRLSYRRAAKNFDPQSSVAAGGALIRTCVSAPFPSPDQLWLLWSGAGTICTAPASVVSSSQRLCFRGAANCSD